MFFVAVVVNAAETSGDLAQRGGILTGLVAIDKFSRTRIADSDDDLGNGLGKRRHPYIGNGVAVTDQNEGGAGLFPGFGEGTSLVNSFKDRGFTDIKCPIERQVV